jgi:hypothetical protein
VTMREFLESRRKAEYPVFVRVLNALPKGRFDYRPSRAVAVSGGNRLDAGARN